MKHTNIAKRALACGLAFAMVLTSGNISSVNVSAAKKSKAKLNKSKVSVIAGSTTTIKVKKAKKKVKWSTSNKKIAKVTKTSGKKKTTATIMGVKKGSAVITAKVGGKKLKCKVKVKANQIKSVSVDKLDYSALTVKFTKKTSLNVSDVKVAYKDYKSGKYNRNPKVEALSTKDQKTYRLYLTSNVPLNDYVKLTFGKYTKEVQNKQAFMAEKDAVTLICEKDSVVNTYLDKYFLQSVGEISYSLKKGSKLPSGLSLVGKRGLIKGIPTAAGATTVKITAQDEAGRKATLDLTYKIYDETTIAAADSLDNEIKLDDYMASLNASKLATAVPTSTPTPSPSSSADVDTLLPTPSGALDIPTVTLPPTPTASAEPDSSVYETYTISPLGGSGSYKYDLVQNGTDAGVKLTTDVTDANNQVTKKAADSTILSIPYGLAAGVHTYTINITDAADAARTTTATVNINVVDNFNISGTVKDALDNALAGNERIYFYPADAVNASDYLTGRTYLKSQKKKVTIGEGDYSYTYTSEELTGGNHPDNYYDEDYDSYESFTCENGDKYQVFTQDCTSKVGPFPKPTVLTTEPTPAPSAAAGTPTAAPTTTPFKVADVAAGNYQAEVPAGTYTVKVEGNNGVNYQLEDPVTVSADALGAVNLTMPVRFANVTATAKFANDKAVANDWIYFETENRQYEWWTFAVKTNYAGSFTASLPAGSYKMYWLDENDHSQYFANGITVEDGTNVELGDQKLSVSRYEVTGSLKLHEIDSETGQETDTLAGREDLYFYDANGNVMSVTTQYARTYDVTAGKYVYGEKHGTFDKLLLDNGTYTVRYYGNYGLSTIGTVVVNGADVKQDFVYNTLPAGFANEYANAAALTLEQESVLTSSGNNDLLVKFVIPDTAEGAANVKYDVSAYLNGDQSLSKSVSLYKEYGTETKSYEYIDTIYDKTTLSLSGGTYLMNVTPFKNGKQVIGNVNVKVAKHLRGYEKSSTALTLNTPATIVCAKNVTDEDLKYVAYVKLSVVEGKTYEISYASKTIGADDIDVDVVSGDVDDLGHEYGSTAGTGTYTIRAESSGDVYLSFATAETIYTSIDVTATEK